MNTIGLNGDLFLGLSGLQVSQENIDLAGENLANENTPGASRQVLSISSGTDVNIGGTNLGTGVVVNGVENTRNTYADTAVQQENSNLGYADTVNTFMSSAQDALSESLSSSQVDATKSQTGLEAASTNFFDSWSTLAADPTSSVDQDAVSAAGTSFVNTANTVYNQILDVKSSLFTQASSDVTSANQLISQIATLNKQIENASAGTTVEAQGLTLNQPTTLIDERQTLIQNLSSLVNITVTPNSTNSVMDDITLTDSPTTTLVSGTVGGGALNSSNGVQTYSLSSNAYSSTNSLTISAVPTGGTPVVVSPTGGNLGGLVYMDNDVIGAQGTTLPPTETSTLIGGFTNYVSSVITGVNALTNSGTAYGSDGTAGEDFFSATADPITGTFVFSVNNLYNESSSTYDSAAIPTATTDTGTPTDLNADGSNALAIAALNTSSTSDANVSNYVNVVSNIGFAASSAATNYQDQQLVSTQVNNQQASYSGISTNEETTDLITFQNAYQSSAHFINVVNEMYQTLMSLGTASA